MLLDFVIWIKSYEEIALKFEMEIQLLNTIINDLI